MAHISEINWSLTPFTAQRWIDAWAPAAAKATEYGAEEWRIYRSTENPLLFRQVITWKDKADFESYWYSEEISAARAEIVKWYDKPLLPVWCTPILSSEE
jgi:quinol monooxygenase YgiN